MPVYHSYCPINPADALALCTKFSEDDKVFAVIANFVDFSGDAQTCLAKRHKTVLITFQLSQQIMDKSPPGLILQYPGGGARGEPARSKCRGEGTAGDAPRWEP